MVRLGKAHFESSRTSALRGLRCDRVGANPILHLSSLGYTFDPEGWCTLQTFKDAREFGDSNHFRHFLIQSSHDPFSIPKNGPVAILRDRAAVLGWKIEQDGCFSDEVGRFDFSMFPLVNCSRESHGHGRHLWPERFPIDRRLMAFNGPI